MKYTEDYINELLAKYLAGETLSRQETDDIQEWIVSHTQEYNRLIKLVSPQKPPVFNTEKAWERIEQHIDRSISQKEEKVYSITDGKKKRVSMSVFYVAASVIVLMVVSTLFFLKSQQTEEMWYANHSTVKEKIYLPDSSSVILYPNANVSYKSRGDKYAREIKLNGKAFFDVRKMNGRAFKVEAERILVEVLGTSFLVDTANDGKAGVYVKTGIVSVKSENNKVVIKANQKAELEHNVLKTGSIENPFQIFEEQPRFLSFTNVDIADVAAKIEQVIGLKIDVEKKLQNNKITSKINLDDVDAIVAELAFLCDCKYEVIEPGKHYKLYK